MFKIEVVQFKRGFYAHIYLIKYYSLHICQRKYNIFMKFYACECIRNIFYYKVYVYIKKVFCNIFYLYPRLKEQECLDENIDLSYILLDFCSKWNHKTFLMIAKNIPNFPDSYFQLTLFYPDFLN